MGQPDTLIGLVEITQGFVYSSGQEAVAHFGLADRKAVFVRVVLPHDRGILDRWSVSVNQRVRIE